MTDLVSAVPPHEPAEDTLVTVAKAGLSLIPAVGGLFAETLAHGMQLRQGARQHEFNERVARRLDDLLASAAHRVTLDDVLNSDEFLAGITRASRIAAETASHSKRERLAAAAANSGEWSAFVKRERTEFARLVEDFDDLHVWLLHYLSDPAEWLEKNGHLPSGVRAEDVIGFPKPTPHLTSGDENPLTTVFGVPFKTYYPVLMQVVGDLERAALTSNELRDQLRRLWPALHGVTNDKGRRFLEYLGESSSRDAAAPEL